MNERLPHVVFMRGMHQKLVVTDQRWSIFGSMNMLSHGLTSSNRLRDFMVTVDGAKFAARLLDHQNAGELVRQRTCPTCRTQLAECGLVGSGADRRWAWLCDEWKSGLQGHLVPFPGGAPPSKRR